MYSSLYRLNKIPRVAARSLLRVQAARFTIPTYIQHIQFSSFVNYRKQNFHTSVYLRDIENEKLDEPKKEEKNKEENLEENIEEEDMVDEFYEEQEKLRAKGYSQEEIDEILFKEFEEEEKPKEEEIKTEEKDSVKEKPKEKKSFFSGLFGKKSSKIAVNKKEETEEITEEKESEKTELKEGEEGEEQQQQTKEIEKKQTTPKVEEKKKRVSKLFGKFSFNFKDEITGAWSELVNPDRTNNRLYKEKEVEKEEEEELNKTPEQKEEEMKKETENINKEAEKIKSQLVVSEYTTAWDRFSAYLKNAPLIEDIMSAGQRMRETAIGETVTDSIEHFREQWETSQHPLVYKMSEVYSEVFSENDVRASVREVQKTDPTFLEIDFQQEINNDTIPTLLHSYLDGNTDKLKEICNEACYSKLAAAIQQRKADNLSVDGHIIKIKPVRLEKAVCMEKEKPIFIYMTSMHHINCIKDSKGKIIEGREDLVMETFYLFAFQLELDMKRNSYDWKLADIQQAGSMPVI